MIRKGRNITSVTTHYGSSSWTCSTFSSLYLEQQDYRSNYPNPSRLVSAHSRDGSVITSLLRVGHLVPTYRTHPKQCVFPVSHPSLCSAALLSNGPSLLQQQRLPSVPSLERLQNCSKKKWSSKRGKKRMHPQLEPGQRKGHRVFMFVWHYKQHAAVLWTCSWCVYDRQLKSNSNEFIWTII